MCHLDGVLVVSVVIVLQFFMQRTSLQGVGYLFDQEVSFLAADLVYFASMEVIVLLVVIQLGQGWNVHARTSHSFIISNRYQQSQSYILRTQFKSPQINRQLFWSSQLIQVLSSCFYCCIIANLNAEFLMQEDDHLTLKEQQIQYWMRIALQKAQKAIQVDQVPVGCVFIRPSAHAYQQVCSSHNLTNLYNNASRHCEINCLYQMQSTMTKQQISKCLLVVTVEPCIMCTFALNLMGISEVYFGQFNDKFGGCGSVRRDNKFLIRGGVMQKESLQLIKSFYERGNQRLPQEQRNRGRKKVKRQQ